jgi:alpha-galactosidase
VDWTQLALKETQTARDLWRQQDLGSVSDSFTAKVPAHGVIMVRLTSAKPNL